MKKSIILFLSIFISLQAQILTLQTCIKKALTSHPNIQAFMLKLHEQNQNLKMQRSLKLPQVSLFAEYDPYKTYVIRQNGSLSTIDDNGWNAGISLNQRIYDFSKTSHTIRAAKIRKEISYLSLEEAKAFMRYQIKLTYGRVLLQKEAIKFRQMDVTAKKALYKQAKALFKKGLKTKADEMRFLSAFYQAEDALAVAKADYEKALISLEEFIGEKIAKDTSFEDNLLIREVKREPFNIIDNNFQIRIAKKNKEASFESYHARKAERFGLIDIVASANHFDTLSRYNTATLGIRYSIPLYSGGRIKAKSEQSRIAAMVAAKEEDAKRREILKEIRFILAELKEIKKRINAYKAQLRFAKEIKDLTKARYKEGLATYVEVLDSQALWLNAKLGLIGAYYARLEREWKLEYLNGK